VRKNGKEGETGCGRSDSDFLEKEIERRREIKEFISLFPVFLSLKVNSNKEGYRCLLFFVIYPYIKYKIYTMSKSSSAGILPPPRLMGMKGGSSTSSNGSNSGYFKAVDEIDRYMKQMESDNGPIGSKDVAELQLHYAKKMRQVSGCRVVYVYEYQVWPVCFGSIGFSHC